MYLTYRPAQAKDLRNGFQLVNDRFFYSKSDLPRLFSFWRHLMDQRIASLIALEDGERSPENRLVAFAISLFTSNEFTQNAKKKFSLPIAPVVFQQWLKGNRVFLNPKEIALQNSGDGLNLLGMHFGWGQKSADETIQIQRKMLEVFYLCHSGFRIKEYFQDVFDVGTKEALLAQGFQLLRSGKTVHSSAAKTRPHSVYLIGAHRSGPLENLYVRFLFHSVIPRFGFSQGEKDVLEKALLGETDQEIAISLRVTVWAVKKRWQGIYEKVEITDSSILVPVQTAFPPKSETRIERRRFLLDYLRQHLEEIRPTLKARRKRFNRG